MLNRTAPVRVSVCVTYGCLMLAAEPGYLDTGDVKTMTKASAWMLAEAVVSFVGPAAASPETGERVELRSVSGG